MCSQYSYYAKNGNMVSLCLVHAEDTLAGIQLVNFGANILYPIIPVAKINNFPTQHPRLSVLNITYPKKSFPTLYLLILYSKILYLENPQ